MADLPSPLYSGASGASPRSTRSTIKLQPDTRQLTGLFNALKALDKEANTSLREDVASISMWSAQQIKMAAFGSEVIMSGQAKRVAETVKGNKDRIPNVTIGGAKMKFSGGAVSGMVVMGNEWGSTNFFPNGGRRFPYPTYPKGNWIFPALRDMQPDVTKRWQHAVEKVLGKWDKG